jgi:hypothetical protein
LELLRQRLAQQGDTQVKRYVDARLCSVYFHSRLKSEIAIRLTPEAESIAIPLLSMRLSQPNDQSIETDARRVDAGHDQHSCREDKHRKRKC